MALSNILQAVQTYQKAELAFLLNSFCFLSQANKKFQNFQEKTANLGDTITFDLAPRYSTVNGLVISLQDSVQRVQSLVCSQAANVASGYTDQQFIFNVKDYMDRFGMAAMKELGSKIESDVALNVVSGVVVSDPQNSAFGTAQTNSGPYRFYGNGVTAIDSYTQLATALANFRDYGAANGATKGFLPTVKVPAIIGTSLSQFAINRNNDTANSWELGRFSECEWYESNLLPTHTSGFVGDASGSNNILTVVSTNDPTGANITQITFTEPTSATAAGAIKAGDLLQFNDGVSGKTNLRYLTFIGHNVSAQSVQVRATADAASVAGTVVVNIFPPLVSVQNQNQNLNTALIAGMKATPLPSHRAGLIYSGDPLYLAMPQLPDVSPYTSVSQMDKDSGASIRHYFGSQFGQNVRAYVRDAIWGSTLVPENCMRLVFPL